MDGNPGWYDAGMNAGKRPNIVLIVLDTARADHFSYHGYARRTTPCIDAIARESRRFKRAYSTSAWTAPAHASLFTGMYSSKHGVSNHNVTLDRKYSTLAEVLALEGYRTVAFSNNPWVSGMTGISRGFEERVEKWAGQKSVGEGAIVDTKLLEPERVEAFLRKARDTRRPEERDKGSFTTNVLAKEWLGESSRDGRPFFMFLNYMESHLPYDPPVPYSRGFMEGRFSNERIAAVNQDMRKQWAGAVSMSMEDFDILGRLYDAELRYLDMRVGELAGFLKERGLLDSTVLIITSDHGENIGEHGLMDHQLCLYDALLHVPMMVRWPSRLGTGDVNDRMASIVDVFPTILDLLDVRFSLTEELQGESLFGSSSRKNLYAEYESPIAEMTENRHYYPADFDPSVFDRSLKVVRDGRHKLIAASDGRHELYDLLADPGETANLHMELPEVSAAMHSRLDEWLRSFSHAEARDTAGSLGKIVKERLAALGYF